MAWNGFIAIHSFIPSGAGVKAFVALKGGIDLRCHSIYLKIPQKERKRVSKSLHCGVVGEEDTWGYTLSKCDCGYFFNFGERIGGDLSRVDIIFGKRPFLQIDSFNLIKSKGVRGNGERTCR